MKIKKQYEQLPDIVTIEMEDGQTHDVWLDDLLEFHQSITLTIPDAVRYLEDRGVDRAARSIRAMCQRGRIPGAYKDDSGAWVMTTLAVDKVWDLEEEPA